MSTLNPSANVSVIECGLLPEDCQEVFGVLSNNLATVEFLDCDDATMSVIPAQILPFQSIALSVQR